MVPVIYPIEPIGSGRIAIMGRPRSGEWAEDEFKALSNLGVTDIVSLLEPAEARELELQDEAKACERVSIDFHSFPIPDRGVPTSATELSRLACRLYHLSAGGRSVAIHCRAGIGRSSLVAAAVLLHCGHNTSDAFAQISKKRGLQVPDTPEQAKWLTSHYDTVVQCHHSKTASPHGQPTVA